ncbi:acetylxylan esterase [Microbacterium sp. TPD7012]|uniref:acetylxylan esterase n=1 Tax=Microbacterium sp. TPD7012 TaxID=2171975 RepID=UPI000D51BE0E|nr:acetylxylan esterase [Microbacterium sp. TPD7012]PVE96907.1 acetylesterase [Microbacterium sp. TPD7012]
MLVDLEEDALWEYRSQQHEPEDFDSFWAETLAASAQFPLNVRFARVDARLTNINVYDFSFAGFDGQTVRGWLLVPTGSDQLLPTTVKFVGYGGGRGHILENLVWPSAGFAHVVMDTRGQGGVRRIGATPDTSIAGPSTPGFMTRGIDSPFNYYYRRLIVDAVRCVAATRELPMVDTSRIAAVGRSQGGGLALAVAGLDPELGALVSQVPFLCDMSRATRITNDAPYSEIVQFLATYRSDSPRVLEVLSYFDGVNFASRAQAPAWFSAGLMDSTCPPSTVFGAFHRYGGEKDMMIWKYNGHEGGDFDDEQRALDALNERFGPGQR